MIYYTKNIIVNNKKIELLNHNDIKDLNIINYNNNMFSIKSISEILEINNEQNNKVIDKKSDNLLIDDNSSIDDNGEIDDNSIEENNLIEDFNNMAIKDDICDIKFYISQNIKDIDLEKFNGDIIKSNLIIIFKY